MENTTNTHRPATIRRLVAEVMEDGAMRRDFQVAQIVEWTDRSLGTIGTLEARAALDALVEEGRLRIVRHYGDLHYVRTV